MLSKPATWLDRTGIHRKMPRYNSVVNAYAFAARKSAIAAQNHEILFWTTCVTLNWETGVHFNRETEVVQTHHTDGTLTAENGPQCEGC